MPGETMQRRQIVLDFDGVIADSVCECLVCACNALASWRGSKHRILDGAGARPALAKAFARDRPLAKAAEDFVFILLAAEEGVLLATAADFDAFRARHRALAGIFNELFYAERAGLQATLPREWAALNPLFPGMRDFLAAAPAERLLVVTTKERAFAHRILLDHGIAFPIERMHTSRNKAEVIERELLAAGVHPAQITFYDDFVETLVEAQPLEIDCALPLWGYVNEAQRRRAGGAGIRAVALTEFFAENAELASPG